MNLFNATPPQPPLPSAEMKLLRLCARFALGQKVEEAIRRQVDEGIDWGRARALAHHHRVLPSLYRGVFSACPEGIPFDALAQLRRDYQANAARNLHLTQELLGVLDLFGSYGIQAIPFKGPALAEHYYGDVALRQFDDLDVLIREGDVREARDVLMGEGFQPVVDSIRSGDPWILREEGEYNFYDPSGEFKLEVHWQAVPRTFLFKFTMGPLWDRACPAFLAGAQVPSLSPEDTLLVLAMHGLSHAWGRLGWVCDLGQVIRKGEVDWPQAFGLAQAAGAEAILRIALTIAERSLGIGLPKTVALLMGRDESASRVVDQIESAFVDADQPIVAAMDPHLLRLRAATSLEDRLGYLTSVLTSPSLTDREIARLPHRLGFLAHFLRPLRVLAQLGFRPLAAWIADIQAGGTGHFPE